MDITPSCEASEDLKVDDVLRKQSDEYYQQITIDKISCFMFPGIPDEKRLWFYSIFKFFQAAQKLSVIPIQVISIIGIISSLFQIVILSRKIMRQSSTNIILLGIAFCDIMAMINNIKAFNFQFIDNGGKYGDECDPPTSYSSYMINISLDTILSTFRRCSPWLAVFLALIRYFAVKFYAQSEKFTRPKVGVYTFIIILLFCSFFGFYSWTQLSVVEDKKTVWTSGKNCPNPGLTLPVYRMQSSDYFLGSGDTIWTKFTLWNGVFSKVIPGILLPVFTILLLVQLAKTRNVRSHVSGENSRKNRTSLLVILMATAFIISELPLGFTIFFQSLLLDAEEDYLAFGVINIITLFGTCWNMIATLSSVIHVIICFALSAQYRETAAKLIGRGRVGDTRTATISDQRGTSRSFPTQNH